MPNLYGQALDSGPSVDVGLALGKNGIGPGPKVFVQIHVIPRLTVDPLFQYAWTGDVDTGYGGRTSGSQLAFGIGNDITIKRWRRFEFDARIENGFQKSRFHYNVVVDDYTFSGVEHRNGYYLFAGGKVKYRLRPTLDLSFTVGRIAYGDPTDDTLGRTVFSGSIVKRVHLKSVAKFFR